MLQAAGGASALATEDLAATIAQHPVQYEQQQAAAEGQNEGQGAAAPSGGRSRGGLSREQVGRYLLWALGSWGWVLCVAAFFYYLLRMHLLDTAAVRHRGAAGATAAAAGGLDPLAVATSVVHVLSERLPTAAGALAGGKSTPRCRGTPRSGGQRLVVDIKVLAGEGVY